ncbi:MAG: helix-turn-helix domain-containing protein, partial [Chloroflexota bacterium]
TLAFLNPHSRAHLNQAPEDRKCWEMPLQDQIDTFEKTIPEETLTCCNGNRSRAARRLSINRTTLIAKLKKHGLMNEAVPELCEI